jgi:hypothetical protein
MPHHRKQSFRERMPIVAKMVDSAFNGDAHQHDDRVSFAVVAVAPSGDASMCGNIDLRELTCVVLEIVAQQRGTLTDETVGHA